MPELIDVEVKKAILVRARPELVYDAFATARDSMDGSLRVQVLMLDQEG